MKITAAVALRNKNRNDFLARVIAYLDSLPGDEIKTAKEVGTALGRCSRFHKEIDMAALADHTDTISSGHGSRIRIFGSRKAIRELRKQLANL